MWQDKKKLLTMIEKTRENFGDKEFIKNPLHINSSVVDCIVKAIK